MKKKTPYRLIAKFFVEQCTESEKESLFSWRKENIQHEQIFEELRSEWNEIDNIKEHYTIPDKNKIWEQIKYKQYQSRKEGTIQKRFYSRQIAFIAAIALLLIVNVSFLYYYKNKGITSEDFLLVHTSPGQKTKLVLPDSTIVWLNSDSKITYPSGFNTLNRSISLQGEAYFEVKKSSQIPFIVNTEYINIKVMGTTFNVKAYNDDTNVSVALVNGHVRLLHRDKDEILTDLIPNQIATIDVNDMKYIVSNCDAELEGLWHMNKLIIADSPIHEIWKKIELWYGVKIKVSNQNPDIRYRFTVKTESLTELLYLINRLTPIEYEINGEEVNIRYK